MESKADDIKGRIKKAAGELTDDDQLKREGSADRAGSKVKQAAEKLKDVTSDAVDAAKKKI